MTSLIRFSLGFMLVFSALFLIALVLIQRGRGGGLAGAFGGMGGQSAFGTKAGDVFTRITVVVAAVWILLCILAINLLGRSESLFSPTLGGTAGQAVPAQTTVPPAAPPAGANTTEGGSTAPADDGKAETKTDAAAEPTAETPAATEPATPAAATPAAPTIPDVPATPVAPAAK
ncbi:MAG: preprotein translocase subunit SecG [Planctomycetota bacterium]